MTKFFLSLGLLLASTAIYAQNVTVKGIVKNSKDSIVTFQQMGQHLITREMNGQRYKALLDHQGKFEITLPEEAIKGWLLETGDNYSYLDLQTGHPVNLSIDFTKKENPVIATGENAAEANFLNYLVKKRNEKYTKDYHSQLKQSNPKDALVLRKEKREFTMALLNDYHQKYPLNAAYFKWVSTLLKYEPYERTMVESASSLNIVKDSSMVALLLEAGINDDYAAKNSIEYNDLINMYMHFNLNRSTFPLKISDFFDYGTKGGLTGLTKQMFLTRQMAILAKSNNDSVYNSKYQKFIKEVNDKDLIGFIDQRRQNYLANLADAGHSKENINRSASLNEIFQKYKGKVVYVDFWASWCGPCKNEMPNSNALKAKLKDKNVAFVYLGYNDQKENWLMARKELQIEGEHYLLNPQLIKEADELFKISGIPHYVIIDKDGTIVSKKASRPSDVYEQLVKLEQSKP